jgi:hypothetical protein
MATIKLLENGIKINCMELLRESQLTVKDTLDSAKMVYVKVMVDTNGAKEKFIIVSG